MDGWDRASERASLRLDGRWAGWSPLSELLGGGGAASRIACLFAVCRAACSHGQQLASVCVCVFFLRRAEVRPTHWKCKSSLSDAGRLHMPTAQQAAAGSRQQAAAAAAKKPAAKHGGRSGSARRKSQVEGQTQASPKPMHPCLVCLLARCVSPAAGCMPAAALCGCTDPHPTSPQLARSHHRLGGGGGGGGSKQQKQLQRRPTARSCPFGSPASDCSLQPKLDAALQSQILRASPSDAPYHSAW